MGLLIRDALTALGETGKVLIIDNGGLTTKVYINDDYFGLWDNVKLTLVE